MATKLNWLFLLLSQLPYFMARNGNISIGVGYVPGRVRQFVRLRMTLYGAITLGALVGCTTLELPDYPIATVDQITLRSDTGGSVVAVRPISDKTEQKEYFGMDLGEVGIFPILVVIDNKSQDQTYLIRRSNIELYNPQVSIAQRTQSGNDANSSQPGEGIAVAGGVGLIVVPILGIPAMLTGIKMVSNSKVIQHNLTKKELQDTTLSPGEATHGFVYFKLPTNVGGEISLEIIARLESIPVGEAAIHRLAIGTEE